MVRQGYIERVCIFSGLISEKRRGHLDLCSVNVQTPASPQYTIDLGSSICLIVCSQIFEYLSKTLYKHALDHLEAARPEKKTRIKKNPSGGNASLFFIVDLSDWSGVTFSGGTASPMSSSSTVHGGESDTKHASGVLLFHGGIHG